MNALSRLAPIAVTALAEFTGDCAEPTRGRWESLQRGTPVVAALDGPWLVMSAPVASCSAPRELLERNRTLPGLVKFALSDDGVPQLHAEIPLDDEAGPLICDTRSAFSSTLATLAGEQCLPFAVTPECAIATDEIRRLCEEAGWNPTPRSDGTCAVEMECSGGFYQASVIPHEGGIRTAVELAKFDENAAETVSAVVTLLLEAAGALRMARPVIGTNEGRAVPAFEVTFSAAPTTAQLAHALSALSVACQLCAEEVSALRNQNLAREYLTMSRKQKQKGTRP